MSRKVVLDPCPCNPKKMYLECCAPYHRGEKLPETPEILMRSRYSAYAKHRLDYVIETTHPQNPQYLQNPDAWKKQIREAYDDTEFVHLKIISHIEDENHGFVEFKAHLKQGAQDVSFQEKSEFVKENGKWYYLKGKIR